MSHTLKDSFTIEKQIDIVNGLEQLQQILCPKRLAKKIDKACKLSIQQLIHPPRFAILFAIRKASFGKYHNAAPFAIRPPSRAPLTSPARPDLS